MSLPLPLSLLAPLSLPFLPNCLHLVPPLFVIEFLHRIMDIFADYFGEFSDQKIRDNYVIVYEVRMNGNGIQLSILNKSRETCSCAHCRDARLSRESNPPQPFCFSQQNGHQQGLCIPTYLLMYLRVRELLFNCLPSLWSSLCC